MNVTDRFEQYLDAVSKATTRKQLEDIEDAAVIDLPDRDLDALARRIDQRYVYLRNKSAEYLS